MKQQARDVMMHRRIAFYFISGRHRARRARALPASAAALI